MSVRPVHWDEGMFLRPHHFQAASRFASLELARGDKWDQHYNWGIRRIVIDGDALANHRLVIRRLQARFRDGTLVDLPEDGDVPALDFKAALEKSSSVDLFLALPMVHLGRAN
ncbi:MAG: type VI secretion system baseplate subunit TssK, partial [Gemmataceae bacterium]